MAPQSISSADRIRELSAINAEIPAMLQSASLAINALSNRPLSQDTGKDDTEMNDNTDDSNLDQRKEAFTKNTEAYYNGLQSIVARLRRQAYALEEAGIIAAEASTFASNQQRQNTQNSTQARGTGAQQNSQPRELDHITNGGLGNLDVGWLNSRGNKVSVEKEGELVEEAKNLLKAYLTADDGKEG